MVNGGTPSSARRPLTSRATMRSSDPERQRARAIRSRTRPMRSWRGRSPRPNGGASCEVSGKGGDERDAHGSPERSASAAAPQAPSSMNSASGCSRSMVCGEVGGLGAGAFAELAQAGHQGSEAGAGLPVVWFEAFDGLRERLGVQARRTEALDVVDAGLEHDVVAAVPAAPGAWQRAGYSRPGTAST